MSAMQNMGKSVMRVAKNSIKGYSDTQTKVRDATSNDPWGPSGTQMSEIAALTFNQNDFVEIIEMLDKRLNDKGKNWRHVFKSLTVLDYILHAGSENVVQYFRENLYIVKTLKEFQYIDEVGKDQGANVRQKAKDITNLLLDEKRMKSQRASRKDMRNRMAGAPEDRDHQRERPSRASPPAGGDADLQAAIEASKRSAEDEARRHQGDRDLEEALRASREEEERRQRELAANGGGGLFDEQQQGNSLIDLDSSAQMQQPMQTGWMSYNPYAAQQQAQMDEYMRQQQLLELQRQQEQQQMMFAQQQAAYAQQQAYEEHMRQQQMLYAQQLAQQQQQPAPMQPQQTGFGANNPFAAFASPPPASSPAPPVPQTSAPPSGFESSFQPEPAPAPAPAPAPQPAVTPQRTGPRLRADGDAKHGELARMLAGGREDGLDTFGNIGSARVPIWQQKTGQQQQAGQGPMAPQQTGLNKPLNPFGNVSSNYQAPMQFNQPTGYQGQPQQQQQRQQNNEQPFFSLD
ncbi:hypothetical protein JCM10207_000749 [Rhodosporidiobolus poonsookiae]